MRSPGATSPRKQGCWIYGCATLLVVVLAGLILLYIGGKMALKSFSQLMENYTATNAMPIERVVLPAAEWSNLQQRVAAFGQELKSTNASVELTLTAREINALISQDPGYKNMRDRLQIIITNSTVGGKVSFPLDDLGPFKLKGRYLNGTASLALGVEDGKLDVRLKDVQVQGKPLPKALMDELRKDNLARDAKLDPELEKALRQFESIRVEGERIILKSKGPPPQQGGSP